MELAAAQKKLEEALAEYYGWGAYPSLREKVNTAIVNKGERLRIAPSEYCRIAASSQSELLALVEEVPLYETHFFDEPEQFDHLRARILPELITARPPNERLRLWSASCATGEEAYSLAIVSDQASQEQGTRQVEIFASDVRNRALLKASQARYQIDSLRGMDEQTREKYFENTDAAPGGTYTVIPDIRRVVTFRRVNLLDRVFWKGVSGRFDLIVYANQLQYLHSAATRQMTINLAGALRPGGYLMVAPSEIDLITSSQLIQLRESNSFFQRVI
jgi:chemotaxis methyl-accepting protein methylase